MAEAHTLGLGIDHHEALLGKAEYRAALLPMSGSGKALDSTHGMCSPGISILSHEPVHPLAFICKALGKILGMLTLVLQIRMQDQSPKIPAASVTMTPANVCGSPCTSRTLLQAIPTGRHKLAQ